LCEDIDLVGLSPIEFSDSNSAELLSDTLGDVIVFDFPEETPATIAFLCEIDSIAAVKGVELIVLASLDSLEAAFGCCNQSSPQILVCASRTDRMLALSRLVIGQTQSRVCEMTEKDQIVLLRLTEQVSILAEKLDRMSSLNHTEFTGQKFEASGEQGIGITFGKVDQGDRLVRASRPPLPDPRLVRKIIQQRQLRARFFDGDLFADPAWDMLLDLTAARVEHVRVSVTSLCIASGVPPTTALRWITQLSDVGLFERVEDETDRRRAFIQLTDRAVDAMARYFHELGKNAAGLV
jgi:Winged helix DNA-binding domain